MAVSASEMCADLEENRNQQKTPPTIPASVATSSTPLAVCPESTTLVTSGIDHQNWDCLGLHPKIPIGLSVLVVMSNLLCLALFIASNSAININVYAQILANGEEIINLPAIKGYGLVNSIRDMWVSGSVWLAGLIAFFSVFWPYAKICLMMYCWMSPTKWLKSEWRHRFLRWLDEYGKWSLVDSFIMIMMMVAFDFRMEPHGVWASAFAEAGVDGKVRVYMQPLQGFYLFLIATILSVVSGHLMTMCERYVLGIGEFSKDQVESGERRSLCVASMHLNTEKMFAHGLTTSLSVSFLLLHIGLVLPGFEFKFLGLMVGDQAEKAFSALSLGLSVPQSNPWPNNFGIRTLQITFFFFCVGAVGAYLVTLLVLWTVPLKRKVQRHLLVFAQIMKSWSCIDVFCASIFTSVLEIRKFALAIMGDDMRSFNKILSKIATVETFDLNSELLPGFFVLASATLLAIIAGDLVLAKCEKVFG